MAATRTPQSSTTRPAIVVGSDGSSTASLAVRRAARLAQERNAVLHVVTAYANLTAAQEAEIARMPEEWRWKGSPGEIAEDTARQAAAEAKTVAGVHAQIHTQLGDPTTVMIDTADGVGADTIVVGNRGMRGRFGFLRRSVPNRLSHKAHCDVLIVDTSGQAA